MATWRHLIETGTGKVAGEGYLVTAPEGFELVDGPANPEAERYTAPLSLAEQLKAIFEEQELEIQVAFYAFVPQVLTALENDRPDIAQAIIQAAAVPQELETVRLDMLGVFA